MTIEIPDLSAVSKALPDAEKITAAFAEMAAALNPVLVKLVRDLEVVFDNPQIRAALDSNIRPRHPRDPRRRKWPQERGVRERRLKDERDE